MFGLLSGPGLFARIVAFVKNGGKQQFSPMAPEHTLLVGAGFPFGPGQQKDAVTLVQSQARITPGCGSSLVTPICQLTMCPLGPLPGPILFSGKFRLLAVQPAGLWAVARLGTPITETNVKTRSPTLVMRASGEAVLLATVRRFVLIDMFSSPFVASTAQVFAFVPAPGQRERAVIYAKGTTDSKGFFRLQAPDCDYSTC